MTAGSGIASLLSPEMRRALPSCSGEPVNFADQIADFVGLLDASSVPAEVYESAKDRLLDAISTAVASHRTATTRAAVAAAQGLCGVPGPCTVLPTGGSAHPAEAALANGTAVHAILFEDINLSSSDHPGSVIVPAALAAAESAAVVTGRPARMDELLIAIIAGYEVQLRLGRLAAKGVYNRGLRTTAVFGTVGAAAAAASAWRLPADQRAAALALGANSAFGFVEGFAHGTMEPYLQAGLAAQAGLVAAALARSGARTAPTAFEGESGYLRCLADIEPGPQTFPDEWLIRGVAAKPYPISGGKISSVDSALAAREQGLDTAMIRRVVVRLPPGVKEFPGGDKKGPFASMYEAQDSAQFCVAAALLGRPMSALPTVLEQFADPEVSDLTQRIELVSDPGRKLARVEVELDDGSVIVGDVDWSDRQIPTVASMSAKLADLAAARWPHSTIESIIGLVTGPPDAPVAELSRLLTA
jgi:2-methylcitrate dehydratase PrpD